MHGRTLAALSLLAAALAGCTDGPDTYHIEGVQCEPMPWDGDTYGGGDAERLQRLRDHYEGLGVNITSARIVIVQQNVLTVCGVGDGRSYVVEVDGPFPMAQADGWTRGPAPEPDTD